MKLKSQLQKAAINEAGKFLREDRVLVYHYRANGSPVVKDGLAVVPRKELEEILRTHPSLQSTTKRLGPRVRSVDVYQRDLLPAATSAAPAVEEHGNAASNVAGVKFPLQIWLEGLLRGKGQGWKEIVVVSERVGGPVAPPVQGKVVAGGVM